MGDYIKRVNDSLPAGKLEKYVVDGYVALCDDWHEFTEGEDELTGEYVKGVKDRVFLNYNASSFFDRSDSVYCGEC